MNNIHSVGLVLIIINGIISVTGFLKPSVRDQFRLDVKEIIYNKQYYRIITSGFFHVNTWHLVVNMLSLYFFSGLENATGQWIFLLIYMVSLICGNLLALLIRRNNIFYRAVGASGAISGIVFASIAIAPQMEISFFIRFPIWIYGAVYMLITLYGVRSQKTTIGHEAHLGGALTGILIVIILYPFLLKQNLFPILLMTIPAIAFLLIFAFKPSWMQIIRVSQEDLQQAYTIDDKYNSEKADREKQIDELLEKINRKGINSLSAKEKKFLDDYSKRK